MNDDHRQIRESLGAHALGHLGDAERTVVQAHLDGCPECRAELALIAPLAAPLRLVDAEHLGVDVQPPPGLDEVIISRMRAERAEPRRRTRGLVPVAAAAAVVALAAGGLVVGRALAPDAPTRPLEAIGIDELAPEIEAEAEVINHTWGMEIVLTGSGFRKGEPYGVTVVDDDGAEVSAGEFIGTGDNPMVCNLNSSVLRDDAAGFEVTGPNGEVVLATSV
ncbi:MAG: zf-HC2 domain-containing protein [Actinomycetota bacterium]|nr:zf-HC2 domain-containing protein [Actinomycetota bacterium]